MAIGGFKPKAAGSAKKGASAPAKAKPKSRYAGTQFGDDRNPMPGEGEYIFRFVSAEEAQNPGTMKESVKVFVLDPSTETTYLCLFMRTPIGMGELLRLYAAAGGIDKEDYDSFDPDREFMAAVAGASNEYSALTLVGRLVHVVVTRGKSTPEGDWYRKYQWTIIPDEQQDETMSVQSQLEAQT